MESSEILLVAVAIGVIPAMIASNKGHNFWPWWLYGTLLFIVALPHSLLVGSGADNISNAALSKLLAEVEARPGQTQETLAVRAGLEMPQVIRGLVDLHARGMVTMQQTGRDLQVGREQVPETQVFPANP